MTFQPMIFEHGAMLIRHREATLSRGALKATATAAAAIPAGTSQLGHIPAGKSPTSEAIPDHERHP